MSFNLAYLPYLVAVLPSVIVFFLTHLFTKSKFTSQIILLKNSLEFEIRCLEEKIVEINKENLIFKNQNQEVLEQLSISREQIVRLETLNKSSNERIIEINTDNQDRILEINKVSNNRIAELNEQLQGTISKKEELEIKYREAECNLSSVNSEKLALQDSLKLINDSLLHQFKSIATEILDDHNTKFNETSKEKLNVLLNPLNQKLHDFQKTVQDCFDVEAKEKFSLKESIHKIIASSDKMCKETSKLADNLKSNNMILGHWGEIVLENVLISCGLRANQDYELQEKSGTNTSRPDAIIHLPNKKCIIIDAKTSYFDGESFNNATSEEDKKLVAREFTKRIRNQIDNLASKEYHHNSGMDTPELTIMFVPVESWYNLAIQQDSQLYEYAWRKNIAIVSSSTLFVILKTISYIWKHENREKNSLEIAKRAGALYDHFVDFTTTLSTLGKFIVGLNNGYEKALSKLSGERGLMRRVERIKDLGGIDNKKNLEPKIIHDAHEAIKHVMISNNMVDNSEDFVTRDIIEETDVNRVS